MPIEWGARLTGRSGGAGGGDNWGVVRAKRQIGTTSLGFLSTRHEGDAGVNSLYGADVDVQATPRLKLRSFWAITDGIQEGRDQTGGLAATYRGPKWRWSLDALEVGNRFGPEMGFLSRRRLPPAGRRRLHAGPVDGCVRPVERRSRADVGQPPLRLELQAGSRSLPGVQSDLGRAVVGRRSMRDRQAILKLTYLFAV